jgi:hypothetical protein
MAEQHNDPLPAEHAVPLHQNLVSLFSEDELKQLCFELDVDYEALPGSAKPDKARELIQYFERRDTVAKLLAACIKARPNVTWPSLPTQRPNPTNLLLHTLAHPKGNTPKPERLKNVLAIVAALGGLGGLAGLLNWISPRPPTPPAATVTADVLTPATTATAANFGLPEFKVEQFHAGFGVAADLPPEEGARLLKIPLQPETKGRVKPRGTDDFVWLLACQLDIGTSQQTCRATRLRLADNGVWDEVVNIFGDADVCHDFEVRMWLVNGVNDKLLNILAAQPFAREQLDNVQVRAPDTLKVRVGLDKDHQEVDCGVSAETKTIGIRAPQRR